MKTRIFLSFFNLILFFSLSAASFQNVFSQKKLAEKSGNSYLSGGDQSIAALIRPRIFKSAAEKTKTAVPEKSIAVFEIERRVFDLINDKRRESGLPPLIWSDNAAKIARLHSDNMANFNFFSHAGLDGKMVNGRADSLGVKKWRQIGENIAYNRGFGSPPESAVQSWLNSPAHRENILKSDWQESGIGVAAAANGTYYFTQVFLRK